MASISKKSSRRNVSQALTEILESRRLMSVTLGANAIVNPGGESNAGASNNSSVVTPTGWTVNGTPTILKYTVGNGFPTSATPGPSSRGANFFAGGPGATSPESDLFQNIDTTNLATQIDAGKVSYNLSAYLGGFLTQTDNASVFVNFQGPDGFLGQTLVGPVSATDRGNATALLLRSIAGKIPVGTRTMQVQIHFDSTGGYNDGYADNLSLVLTAPATTGTVAGTVFNDTNTNGTKDSAETGMSGVKVFLDKNNNGVADTGELTATTAADGTYKISGVTAGTYSLREITPSTYRTTSTNPISVTVGSGANVTGKNFGLTQFAKITGSVFNDTNGNKIKDSTETARAGAIVYLDFNNNGQLDSFELTATTDSSGNYSFNVPFGTYTVRVVVPAGKTLTTPTSSYSLTLTKAQVATGKVFGIK